MAVSCAATISLFGSISVSSSTIIVRLLEQFGLCVSLLFGVWVLNTQQRNTGWNIATGEETQETQRLTMMVEDDTEIEPKSEIVAAQDTATAFYGIRVP